MTNIWGGVIGLLNVLSKFNVALLNEAETITAILQTCGLSWPKT